MPGVFAFSILSLQFGIFEVFTLKVAFSANAYNYLSPVSALVIKGVKIIFSNHKECTKSITYYLCHVCPIFEVQCGKILISDAEFSPLSVNNISFLSLNACIVRQNVRRNTD